MAPRPNRNHLVSSLSTQPIAISPGQSSSQNTDRYNGCPSCGASVYTSGRQRYNGVPTCRASVHTCGAENGGLQPPRRFYTVAEIHTELFERDGQSSNDDEDVETERDDVISAQRTKRKSTVTTKQRDDSRRVKYGKTSDGLRTTVPTTTTHNDVTSALHHNDKGNSRPTACDFNSTQRHRGTSDVTINYNLHQ